ncbi:hypothetical protein HMPREF1584_01342 [Gardnerella vaginalis JCP8481A]|nr:hypothetical protein HMPREF1584_01342 [Gardnerella vaginalis JCP8481A]
MPAFDILHTNFHYNTPAVTKLMILQRSLSYWLRMFIFMFVFACFCLLL